MGSRRVGHLLSNFSFTFMHWRRKWQPTPVFLPGESQGREGGAWWAAVYGVAQSRTRLKGLSSSSSSILYAQLKVYKLPLKIKLRALLKAWSPRVVPSCFFFSPFLFCSSFRTFNWNAGVLWDHLLAWASKTHSRRCPGWGTFSDSREHLRPPWSELVRCHELN